MGGVGGLGLGFRTALGLGLRGPDLGLGLDNYDVRVRWTRYHIISRVTSRPPWPRSVPRPPAAAWACPRCWARRGRAPPRGAAPPSSPRQQQPSWTWAPRCSPDQGHIIRNIRCQPIITSHWYRPLDSRERWARYTVVWSERDFKTLTKNYLFWSSGHEDGAPVFRALGRPGWEGHPGGGICRTRCCLCTCYYYMYLCKDWRSLKTFFYLPLDRIQRLSPQIILAHQCGCVVNLEVRSYFDIPGRSFYQALTARHQGADGLWYVNHKIRRQDMHFLEKHHTNCKFNRPFIYI